jgi:hypothetical protein
MQMKKIHEKTLSKRWILIDVNKIVNVFLIFLGILLFQLFGNDFVLMHRHISHCNSFWPVLLVVEN